MIFAEEFLPPAGFTTFVAGLSFLIFAVNQAAALIQRFQTKPPMSDQLNALLKTFEEKFVNQDLAELTERSLQGQITTLAKEVSDNQAYVRHLENRIFERLDKIFDKVESRLEGMVNRINLYSEKMSFVDGRTLHELKAKTGNLPKIGAQP